jgi:Ca2+-binding RTX toxin-like protein
MATATINGTNGNDIIIDPDTALNPVDTTINGLEGINRITLGFGNDIAYGGNQKDTIIAGQGIDTAYGRGGDDLLSGGAAGSKLYGEGGNDTINLSSSGGVFGYGGDGNDTILAGGDSFNFNTVFGGPGNDIIYGGIGDDVSVGTGTDVIVFANDFSLNKKIVAPMIVRTFQDNTDKFEIQEAPGLILRTLQSGTSTLIQSQMNGSWETLAEVLFFTRSNMSLVISPGPEYLRYIFS